MNSVETISVHVIRKARRAADAGNENHFLARDAEVRHDLLHVVENRVVAAARTPAYLLVGHEIFLRQFPRRWRDVKERSAAFALRRDCRFDYAFVSVAA